MGAGNKAARYADKFDGGTLLSGVKVGVHVKGLPPVICFPSIGALAGVASGKKGGTKAGLAELSIEILGDPAAKFVVEWPENFVRTAPHATLLLNIARATAQISSTRKLEPCTACSLFPACKIDFSHKMRTRMAVGCTWALMRSTQRDKSVCSIDGGILFWESTVLPSIDPALSPALTKLSAL